MINKLIIIGNLGQDQEKKFPQTGSAVTTFSVATSEKWKMGAQQKNATVGKTRR